ncbi:hypothetical protein ABZ038_09485 [Streptomyces sp. NPDC006349]|uniref:hypothetical protein n=1 Tax=unclassified Streptomyces TaxID=2593676 RepID=UPI00339F6D04
MKRRTRRHAPSTRGRLSVLTALTALTLAACTDAPHGTDTRAVAGADAAPAPDTAACADGDCEITVTEPVTVRFQGPAGPATLSVTDVGPNEVAYTVESGNGRTKGSASGPGQGCTTVLRENGSGNSCGGLSGTRPGARPDAVVIRVAAGTDGTARLHIVSP